VLRAVGDDDFDAVTSERAFRFSQDVQDLSSNSNVEGVDEVINEDLTAKDGVVNANNNNVKGAMYELRVAEGKLARQLDSGETLKLTTNPVSTSTSCPTVISQRLQERLVLTRVK
jgi:hypothetical protein